MLSLYTYKVVYKTLKHIFEMLQITENVLLNEWKVVVFLIIILSH